MAKFTERALTAAARKSASQAPGGVMRVSGNRISRSLLALALAAALRADNTYAWDASGNGMLSGTWNFRQVLYFPADAAGDLLDAASVQGQITFDGNGHYSLSNSSVFDLTAGVSTALTGAGNYTISASGFGYLDSPLEGGDRIYALVSPKGLVGSTTETTNGYTDLFVATQSSPVSALPGTYAIAYFSPSLAAAFTSSALIQITTDGMGNITQSSVNGFTGGGNASGFTAALNGATYSVNNGAGTLNLADASVFAQTTEPFWVSPDGAFLFGGAQTGLDLFVGVRIDPFPGTLSGLYLEGGLDVDVTNLAAWNVAQIAGWYGSLSGASTPILHHRRINTAPSANATGLTFTETGPFAGAQYLISADGGARAGIAPWPHIGIQVAMALPAVPASGVFLDPQSIEDAASSAPFTAGISPGEWITLSGSNLAPDQENAAGEPLPQTLGGVQVLVNGVAAPLAVISAGQISALVPQSTPPGVAAIQVVASGAPSNTVTALVNQITPGAYTQTGSAYAVAIHGDYSLVSPSNPAQPGETIAAYADGLGAVSSPPADGAAAASTLSSVLANVTVDLDGVPSPNIGFVGLSPGLVGTYQINFEVPPSMWPGDHILGITSPGSRTAIALISVSNSSQ